MSRDPAERLFGGEGLRLAAVLVGTGLAAVALGILAWWLFNGWVGVAVFVAASILGDIPLAIMVNRSTPLQVGAEGLLGREAQVVDGFGEPGEGGPRKGRVRIGGELWMAVMHSEDRVDPRDGVRIRGVNGLVLEVEKTDGEH